MNNKKYIYIMFTFTGTTFSRVLRKVTRQAYTHVSISFDQNLDTCYSFGRYSVKDKPWQATFVVEGKAKGVYLEKSNTSAKVFRLEVNEEQFISAQKIVATFERNHEVFRYNFAGLPHIWMGLPLERDTKFVCSQFVAYVLENSNIFSFPKGYSTIRPVDIYQMVNTLVYEGPLAAYSAVGS